MKNSVPTLCGSVASIPNYLGAEMHNAAYAALGIPFTFVAFGADNIAEAVTAFRTIGIRGFGVGVPHKQTIMQHLDSIDPVAKEIGAVNMVVNDDGKFTGYNVDWIGAAKALQEEIDLAGTHSVVVGAGGAARAVIYALIKNGSKVAIYNRDPKKAKILSEEFGIKFGGDLNQLKDIDNYDVLVNATSAGFYNKNDCAIDPKIIREQKIVFEVVHMPQRTVLVQEAEARGAKVIYGYKMLLHLAGHAFKLFTLKDPPLGVMEKALLRRINQDIGLLA